MSLKKNIIASNISLLYVTAISFLLIPLYLKYMGPEAYGLIGFFAVLQVIFSLLDIGLSSTVVREAAKFYGGVGSAIHYHKLIKSLEGIFFTLAIIGATLLFYLANPIARSWLNSSQLGITEVVNSLKIMAILVGVRWISGLYRGILTGSERLVWLSIFNMIIATCRFGLVLPLIIYINPKPLAFFFFQLCIAVIELASLIFMANRVLPKILINWREFFDLAPIRPVLKFSLTIGITSLTWVAVTQADKILLSGILNLRDYGYFTLAVTIASLVPTVSGAITNAVSPKLSRDYFELSNNDFLNSYKKATGLISAMCGVITLVMFFGAEHIIYAWTGDYSLVEYVSPILKLYTLGNYFMVLAGLPYCLQYALGNLRLHLTGSILYALILLPLNTIGAMYWGPLGTGYAWLILNFLWLLLWTYFIHNTYYPGLHKGWIFSDIFKQWIFVPLLIIFYVFSKHEPFNRFYSLSYIFLIFNTLIIFNPYLIKKITNNIKIINNRRLLS